MMQDRSSSAARNACEICRERKVRCDRALPTCGRCGRLDQPCSYNQVVQRRTRDEQLQQLQERLAKTEAQLALAMPKATPSQPTAMSVNNTVDQTINEGSMFDADIFASMDEGAGSEMTFDWTNQPLAGLEPLDSLLLGRLPPQTHDCGIPEGEISQAEMSILHNYYFDYVYFSFPFVNKDRFAAESSSDGGSAARALVYAVAVAGCTHSPKDFDKQILCYNLARDFAEKCERDGNLDDLNFLQALVLIGRFEAMNQRLESSWLTLGRAAMVCKLLNLAQMDHSNGRSGIRQNGHQRTSRLALQDTDDPILLEEWRRTFWALYILQSYVKTRTGWPCQLGDVKDFRIALPMPGLLRSNLTPLKMPLIPNVYEDPGIEISSYAGCVLMVELALRCFDHRQAGSAAGFWDGYCALVKTTDDLFGILKPHLNAISVRTDPVAFSLYLNLRATEIFLHELAMVQSDEQGLPPLMTAESQRRATTAAFQISSAVRLNLPSPGQGDSDIIMLQAIFIAWPLTMALKAFHRELAVGGDRETVNGVVASSRLLLAALDHIEETGGHWHQSVEHVGSKLQEWDEKTGFDSLAL